MEPFFGSGAVLLGAPYDPKRYETVNDIDGMIVNFWRAIKNNPELVAEYADNPIFENDLYARHQWLVKNSNLLSEQLDENPDFYDAKIAGWWVWGLSCWIGAGWCKTKSTNITKQPSDALKVNKKRPHICEKKGIFASRSHDLKGYLTSLHSRLKNVRVTCGSWDRICGPTPTYKLGTTGVFLDPPYSSSERYSNIYNNESMTVSMDVQKWCIENSQNTKMRIALCGYEGEHNILERKHGWKVHCWKTQGGMGASCRKDGLEYKNGALERIWFSPHCIDIKNRGLFDLD